MNQTNKKKSTHKMRGFITIIALFTLLTGCMGCSKKTPREALEEAYDKTFVKNNPTETILGLSELNDKLNENKAHSAGFSVTLQELSGKDLGAYAGILTGLGLSVDSATDLLNRKSAATVDITYGGTTYLTLGSQLQGSEIHVTSPQLLDSSLFVNLSTLAEDLNSDSMLGQVFKSYGLTVPEDFSTDILNALTSSGALENMGDLISAYDSFNEAILVEKVEKKAVSLPADVAFKNVYNVTVPKHAYVALLNALLEYSHSSSASLPEYMRTDDPEQENFDLLNTKLAVQEIADVIGDIVVTVSVTKEGYINYAESTIKYGTDTVSVTAAFSGEKTPFEETSVAMDATLSGKNYTFSFEQSYDTEKNEIDLRVKATEDNTTVLLLDCAGKYTDIVKGEKYTFDVDYLELKLEDILSVSLAGDYYVDTTQCNIAAPKESDYNLFRMKEEDFSTLLQEVIINLQGDPFFSTLLGGFLGSESDFIPTP